MKSTYFLILLTYAEFFAQLESTENAEYALTLIQNGNQLQFPLPKTTILGEFEDYEAMRHSLFYLCPTEPKPALTIVEEIKREYHAPAKKLCHEPVEPTIFQVREEPSNNEQKNDITSYHIGFLINDEQLKNIEKLIKYESMKAEDHFISMISVYRDKQLHQTVAVNYQVFQVDDHKKLEEKIRAYTSSKLFSDNIEQFHHNQKSKLKEILGHNYVESKHTLVIDSLVDEDDFIIDTWKKTARFKVLQILLWTMNQETWKDIRKYIRKIFHNGYARKIITAGVGQALTLTGNGGQKIQMKWDDGEETVYIPELYWIAIEYRRRETDSITGMFIIMHNVPDSEEQNLQKVCDVNVCIEKVLWYPTRRYEPLKQLVYCCPMDTATIKQLGASFLLNEKNLFMDSLYNNFP